MNDKRAETIKRKISDTAFILSFTIVPVLSFLIFYVYVHLDSFVMAFQKPENGKLVFCGLENFTYVFDRIIHGSTVETDNLQLAFINTFKTFGVQVIMFPVGLFVSYFIYKKIWGYRTFRVLFYLPSIVSSVVTSFFFLELMSASSFFPRILEKLYRLDYSLSNPLTDSDFANKMIFFNIIWMSFPGNLIIWGGTFSRIPDSVIESARLDGVNSAQELFRIILPLVWPTLVLMVTLQVAGVFGASGNVFLLTGGGYGTQTVSNWMYMKVLQSANPLGSRSLYQVSAMGLLLTVVSCIIAFFVRKFVASRVEEVTY